MLPRFPVLGIVILSARAVALGCGGGTPGIGGGERAYLDPQVPVAKRVDDLLARMTLDEKVGQMTQPDHSYLKSPDDVAKYFLGSVLSGGGSEIADISPRGWAEFVGGLQRRALATRLAIPLLYGIDAVHGHNNVRGAVVFPHNVGLGCTRNPAIVEKAARITAQEVAATGMHWAFAPCVAVPQDERWGRTYEGFSEAPGLVADLGAAAVRGLQGEQLSRPDSVLASVKHFIGDGGTKDGRDQGDTEVDEATLRQVHLPGYIAAIKAGAATIMASFNSWNGEKLHGHKYLSTSVLKTELGFRGFVVSDWKAIEQLPGDYAQQIREIDRRGHRHGHGARHLPGVLRNPEEGGGVRPASDVPHRRCRAPHPDREIPRWACLSTPSAIASLLARSARGAPGGRASGCPRVVGAARQPERSTATVEERLEPARGRQGCRRHRPAVRGLDDQLAGRPGPITDGTTVVQAIRRAAPAARVSYSRTGDAAPGAQAAVVVIGELPYAEMKGDRTSLELDPEDIAVREEGQGRRAADRCRADLGPTVMLESILPYADALVAAWPPGTEGDGVADVLFGAYNPTGRLSHTWPRSMAQVPINVGPGGEKPKEVPLFDFGFGLSYR